MKAKLIGIIIIYLLLVIFLVINIEYRNNKIWQLETEIIDLKEQVHRLEVNQE